MIRRQGEPGLWRTFRRHGDDVVERQRLIHRSQPVKTIRSRRPDGQSEIDLAEGANVRRHTLTMLEHAASPYREPKAEKPVAMHNLPFVEERLRLTLARNQVRYSNCHTVTGSLEGQHVARSLEEFALKSECLGGHDPEAISL